MRTLRYAARGFFLGVAWGVVARVWMRLVSTSPEFSWRGTLGILGSAGFAGLILGVVHAARTGGGSPWWRLLCLLALVAFHGLGIVLLPAVIGGGWGLRRGVLGRVTGVAALLSAPAILLALSRDGIDTHEGPYPLLAFLVIAIGGVLMLVLTAAWGTSTALGPWERSGERRSSGSPEPAEVTA
jgi:hypothetical protein